jgi:hypothetical protein
VKGREKRSEINSFKLQLSHSIEKKRKSRLSFIKHVLKIEEPPCRESSDAELIKESITL